MGETSSIEWTDATVNFWWGCSKVGPGCDFCYAETWSLRTGQQLWGPGAPRRKIKGAAQLLRRLVAGHAAFHAAHGRHRRVFFQSMADLFDLEVEPPWFAEAWPLIAAAEALDIQIVTKRLPAIEKRLAQVGCTRWPRHAGLLVTVVNQQEANRDVPRLLALKEKLGIPWVGLSMEPLLGDVNLRHWLPALDWIIVGGESGREARSMLASWARHLRDQCAAAGVPFLFKQWGEFAPRPATWTTATDSYAMVRVGKKAAGRLLDGAAHDGFPVLRR